jgi:NADPH:quinone reductase-like Zn-dependent oxidoreductase
MPANMTFEEAVGVTDGATTALTFLRDRAEVRPGQKVLVNGASGAVGTFAVQLARELGAEVTGVCSTKNLELVESLGAHRVIDYTQEDFTRNGETYNVIFDVVGKVPFSRCRGSLKPGGLYLATVFSLRTILQMLWTSVFGTRKVVFAATGLSRNKEDLVYLRELAEEGRIRTVIDRTYPLEEIAEAHRYVDEGHKRGSVVISIA